MTKCRLVAQNDGRRSVGLYYGSVKMSAIANSFKFE